MAARKKLELTWIGKDERPKLEPRILLEDPSLSYHAKARRSERDQFDNRLIFGDNLLALKALEAEFAGKVQCVFIDPPYNTGSAFEHYDDGLEHSLWLSLVRDRLELLWRLLADSGTIWITIDDNEAHYLKVVCDELFGRSNFIGNAVWEKSDSPRMDAQFFSVRHDHVLVFGKNIDHAKWNMLTSGAPPEHYDRLDASGRKYYLKPLRAMGGQGDSRAARPTLYFPIVAPDGTAVFPMRQDGTEGAWRWSEERVRNESDRIEWVHGRKGWAVYFRIYAEEDAQRPPETLWTHSEVGSNRTSKAEVKRLIPGLAPFGTPKPEGLLHRILTIATDPGDVVMDSFAGSGTTGAVAHKLGRRWIMIEQGEHCHTHIVPRLRKVIDGEDPGGVTEVSGWQGGGGFRYYKLAPSLLEKDRFGNWVVSKQYNAAMLAEALCKLEGFTYAPSDTVYWQHGRSTENDFVYVTTQTLSADQLQALSDDVGDKRSLLVLCSAFRAKDTSRWSNLTVQKIPKAVLNSCEWGRDDYSLAIRDLPTAEPEPPAPAPTKGRVTKSARNAKGAGLFDVASGEAP
jgi:adenine-specific DNA-methyltransferase